MSIYLSIKFSIYIIFYPYELFRLGLAAKLMDQTAASMVETFNAKVRKLSINANIRKTQLFQEIRYDFEC